MPERVYLDHNAGAPPRPGVTEAVCAALARGGNPSSVHADGRAARGRIEDARERLAGLVAVPADRVVFTSGGTEANTLALRGAGRPILVSAVEHDSVLSCAGERIPVDGTGLLDLEALDRTLRACPGPALVSLMAVNNETGVIQPVAEAAAIARAHGAWLHCDAVQALGRRPLSLSALGAHMLTVSAHKLGGPQGVGALILADDVALETLIPGGGQERRRRGGTENGPGIAGFGAALSALETAAEEQRRLTALRDDLEARARALRADVIIPGAEGPRVGNTSCLALPGRDSALQVMRLDLAGISVSAGAACSSGKVTASHVLRAMGLSDKVAGAAIRVSLGWNTTASDVDRFLEAWSALARSSGGASAAA